MLNAPIVINLHQPTITNQYGAFLENLAPRCNQYTQSIANNMGYESMSCTIAMTLDQALMYCDLLFAGVQCYDYNGTKCWEGFLNSVEFGTPGRTYSLSLDAVTNRMAVRYSLRGLGTPQITAVANHTASQALYAVREQIVSTGAADNAAAVNLRDTLLAELAMPRTNPSVTISNQEQTADTVVTLGFVGWGAALNWLTLSRADTSNESTTTQIGTLIGASWYSATNPIISTNTTNIVSSGRTDTRFAAPDTTYRSKIDALISKGNSVDQRLVWGFYDNRVMSVQVWAGATPNNITYYINSGSSIIEALPGAQIDPLQIRPNAMVQERSLSGNLLSGIDTGSRFCIERVTVSIDASGTTTTLEPSTTSAADAKIARLTQ